MEGLRIILGERSRYMKEKGGGCEGGGRELMRRLKRESKYSDRSSAETGKCGDAVHCRAPE